MLAAIGIQADTLVDAVRMLDQHPGPRPLPLSASVEPGRVVFETGATSAEVAVPADQFYLAIAPYRSQTHDCYHHSLSGCQGELIDTAVHVDIFNGDDTIVEEDTTTGANGFVGFWVPRGVAGTISISAGEQKGQIPFEATAEAPTCITTLRLA